MKINTNRLISDFATYAKGDPDMKVLQIVAYLIYTMKTLPEWVTHIHYIFIFQGNKLVRVKPDISIQVTDEDLAPNN